MMKLIAAIAVLLAAHSVSNSPASAQPAPPIPIETFADEPFINAPALSPDGKTIAARGLVKGKQCLVLAPLGGTAENTVTMALGDAQLDRIDWLGNQRLLLTTSFGFQFQDINGRTAVYVIVDIATRTSKIVKLASGALLSARLLHLDPNGTFVIVSSQDTIYDYPTVKRIDLPSGKITQLEGQRIGVLDWYTDDKGVVRAGIAYDKDRWTMWYRATSDAPLRKINARIDNAGAVDKLFFRTDAGADANNGIILTNARTGRFAAYNYDFASGTIGDAIYENAQVDVTNLAFHPVTGAVDGATYTDDRFHTVWLDAEMRGIQSRIDAALPDRENVLVDSSRDGNRMLIWSGSADEPGTYFLFDRTAKRITAVARPYSKVAEVTLAPVKPVRYTARDGLVVPGYLTLPLNRPARGLPLIVMPHGGPYVRDTWDYDPYVQFLASRGYAVLQPNFRGSTGYGKAYVEKGYGQWGRAMQDDLDDGVDWLIASGQIDPKRVCIMGASYGGYAALWGAIRNPERYRCAISLSGVTDLADMLRFDRTTFSAPRYFRSWRTKVEGEGEGKIDLAAVSPLAQADRLNIPVLIAHGEKDDNVPPRQAHRMVAALERRHANVESVFYPKAGHGLQSAEDKIDFFKRLERFLMKHNPS